MKQFFFILLLLVSAQLWAACPTDITPPDPVIVDSVSVDPITGNAMIGWQAGSPDIKFYYIRMFDVVTGDVTIDTVYANEPLSYIYNLSNADSEIELYAIGAQDSCGNDMNTVLDYHNTILLSSQIDLCSASANLSWNAYDDFNSGTNVQYKIFVSINSGAYSLAGTTNNLTFTYSGLTPGNTYDFFVRAIENNGAGPFSSSSNILNVTGNFLKNPLFLYNYSASVLDSAHNQVLFYTDTAADIKHYVLKRALATDMIFSSIATVSKSFGMNPLVEFNDYDVDAVNNSYVYKIEAIDVCNQSKITSNIGRTIQLTVTADDINSTNTLFWNLYEGWNGNVGAYDIYRKEGENLTFDYIATYPTNGDSIMIFTDDVYNLTSGNGEFCYKILAREGVTSHIDNLPLASSYSNEDCVVHQPIIYIPNAFNPGGYLNPEFKPSTILFDFANYSLQIYDRWGHPVFNTSDPNEAWNGNFNNNGAQAPIGAYVYVLKLNSLEGKEFVKRGTVTLIR